MKNEKILFDPEILEKEKARDLAEREALFDSLEEKLGSDAVAALKEHYALYDDRYYMWLANLYDPGEYGEDGNPLGGGFYFSNSGRDNAPYRIDIESTMQALHFIKSERSGFKIDGKLGLKGVLPEKMKRELVAFAKSLQSSEDGYFYHPQWESVTTQRRGRDLRWATQLFEMFGERPLWDTPSGLEGTLGAPSGRAKSENEAPAPQSDYGWHGSEQLATLGAWEKYLEEQMSRVKTSSWSVGNLLSAQYMEIKGREKLAISSGELSDSDGDGIADNGYIRATERIINSYQLPNGIWQETPDNVPTFYGVNGLMKLSELYTNLGLKLNYANEALAAALKMAMHEGADADGKETACTCDVFNPLVSLRNLMINMRKYGGAEELDRLQAYIIANAAELIRVSTRKLLKYKKEDGSVGYAECGTSGVSQNAPVAVPYVNEGSINGADIATGVSSHLCLALGIPILPMFTPADFKIFLSAIAAREHTVK